MPRYQETLKQISQESHEMFRFADRLALKLALFDERNTPNSDMLDDAFSLLLDKGMLVAMSDGNREFALMLPECPLEILLTVNAVGDLVVEELRRRQCIRASA